VFALVEAALRCSGVPPADEELVVLLAGAMDVVSAWVGGGERGN
jgi:hypothetical protein